MNFTVYKLYFNKSPSNRIHWVDLTVHKVLQKKKKKISELEGKAMETIQTSVKKGQKQKRRKKKS